MVNEIKNLRVKIDGLAKLTKELKSFSRKTTCEEHFIEAAMNKWPMEYYTYNSKEIEKAVDNLYLAKAWLGKILQELDVPTPYKNDGNRKTVEDIEPTADVSFPIEMIEYNTGKKEFKGLNHIEKVDWLRQEIQKLDTDFDALKITPINGVTFVSFKQHLSEARFWLGFELQRIRESEK